MESRTPFTDLPIGAIEPEGWLREQRALWYRCGSRLIAGVHAPNRLRTRIEEVPVQIQVETEYPFSEKLIYRIEVDVPVRFELCLRIPSWCNQPRISSYLTVVLEFGSLNFRCFLTSVPSKPIQILNPQKEPPC